MRNYLEKTLLSQFAQSLTIRQLMENFNTYIDPKIDIDLFYQNMFDLNTAISYGLDCWGRIVGVGRVLQIASDEYFGFIGPDGQASGTGYGQAPFYNGQSITSQFSLLDDPYRILIRAKALFNICDGSIPAINHILQLLFGPEGLSPVSGNSYVVDNGNMSLTYTFGTKLSPVQAAIVFQSGVLPRPAGVQQLFRQLP